MAQYCLVANLDRKEFLSPKQFGEGVNLWSFGFNSVGTMTGLAILLNPSDGRRFPLDGGPVNPIIGRWAGQRIAIIGDYLMPTYARHVDVPGEQGELYFRIDEQGDGWIDISEHVIATLEMVYRVHAIRERLARDPHAQLRHRSELRPDGSVVAVDPSGNDIE